MGLLSFTGRLLFASRFLLSAWQLYKDHDRVLAAREFAPKLTIIENLFHFKIGDETPTIAKLHVGYCAILKGQGGLAFIFNNDLGALLLLTYFPLMTPLLFDFYNYNYGEPEFWALLQEFSQDIACVGALLFFLEVKLSRPMKPIKKKTAKAKAKNSIPSKPIKKKTA